MTSQQEEEEEEEEQEEEQEEQTHDQCIDPSGTSCSRVKTVNKMFTTAFEPPCTWQSRPF